MTKTTETTKGETMIHDPRNADLVLIAVTTEPGLYRPATAEEVTTYEREKMEALSAPLLDASLLAKAYADRAAVLSQMH